MSRETAPRVSGTEHFVLMEAVAPWHVVLARFWPVAAVSFLLALLATPICRRVALQRGIVDRPDDYLKPHGKAIPYLGGVAIFLGWIGGIALGILSEAINVRTGFMLGIAVAGCAIMLVGLFDDLRVMRPITKLLSNLVVAGFLLWLGLGDRLIHVMTTFMHYDFRPGERWLELAYSVPFAVLIIVGACNATNLIDGLDGLCSGVLGIISAGFFILAAHLRLYANIDVADERIVLALAMLGAAAGFLPYNRNPAKIFMGDAGSMLLGLNAAILILMFGQANMVRWMLGALMVFGLPIADMVLTLIRRWRNGRPLMEGDRSHFYDQLRDRGLSVRQVVAISYLLTLGFVLLGISVIFIPTRFAILVYCISVVVVAALLAKFDMVSIERDRARTTAAPLDTRET